MDYRKRLERPDYQPEFFRPSTGEPSVPTHSVPAGRRASTSAAPDAQVVGDLAAGPPIQVAFGAAVRSVTAPIAQEKMLPAAYGVEVGPVKPGSPADMAGIRAGDVITSVGAYTLDRGTDQFRRAVAFRRPGDTMTVTLLRDGETSTVAVAFPVQEVAAPDPELA